MTDILNIMDNLRNALWKKYGNVLKTPYSQHEIHMTYYVGQLLKDTGYELNSDYRYTEAAANAAFIAGLRIGQKNAKEHADAIVKDRIADAIDALNGVACDDR